MSDQGAGGQDEPEVERCHGLGERAGEHIEPDETLILFLQVRQSGGGGGGIETANIMLAQLNAQKAVKSKIVITKTSHTYL